MMTWALVLWGPAQFVPLDQVGAKLLDYEDTPDLELTHGADAEGRPGVWLHQGPDVIVGFPDEDAACRHVHEEGIVGGITTIIRDPSGFLDGDRVLITDNVTTWAARATFVDDVRVERS